MSRCPADAELASTFHSTYVSLLFEFFVGSQHEECSHLDYAHTGRGDIEILPVGDNISSIRSDNCIATHR